MFQNKVCLEHTLYAECSKDCVIRTKNCIKELQKDCKLVTKPNKQNAEDCLEEKTPAKLQTLCILTGMNLANFE